MKLNATRIPNVDVKARSLQTPLSHESILLTGATGVLGGHLLKELLDTTDSKIYCLVRADDETHATERLLKFLGAYDPQGRLHYQFKTRVTPVLGDIVSPQFGLSDSAYKSLADTIDSTIHVAALTNLFLNYRRIEPVNFGGTQRVVDFALQTRQKYLCYVSTYTVIGDKVFDPTVVFKESDLDIGQGFECMTYQHTKFLAEKWIRAAGAERGLLWNIMRPGQIFGESTTGLYPQGQSHVSGLFYDIFKTVIETKFALESKTFFDVVPVDYVSQGIVHLALKRNSYFETYHLTNPDQRTYSEVIQLLRDEGYEIESIPQLEYRRKLMERELTIEGIEYKSSTTSAFKWWYKRDKFDFTASAVTDCCYTDSVLRQAGIQCHPINNNLMSAYVKACVEQNYFPSPKRKVRGPAIHKADIGSTAKLAEL